MNKERKKVVLLTGASRGLGLAILKTLIKDGSFHIIATARESSLPKFESAGIFESENLWLRTMDVLSKADRDNVLDEASLVLGGVDILINNAGYMLRAVVEHVGEIERFKQMDTNFRAPLALIRSVLPTMRKKHFGRIINISSVGGMMAMPTMAVYSASKFALEGASESLWYEVKPWNIKVTLVQPGFIHSDSYENVKMTRESEKSLHDKNDPYYYHYHSMVPFIARLMNLSPANPEKVAKIVLKVIRMQNPPLRIAGTFDAHIFTFLRRVFPRNLYHQILYYLLPKVLRWGED
ncbi:MAG: SDR family oxidoreductase [Bdellovibrionales bacterium]|nr:SDR family oxidoreductase [Bdellovibrionales bacterium]